MEEEDIKNADGAVQSFFDSLGPNDVIKRIFLEVLLEEIYGERVDLSGIVNWQQVPLERKHASENQKISTNLPGSSNERGRQPGLPS
jgi:hypothetical protein